MATTKKANVSKANKATAKSTNKANAVTPPNIAGGLVLAAKQLPAKVATQIGSVQQVNNTPSVITHVGAIAARPTWGKPQLMAVHAIVKLLKAGTSVMAARTCRYLTAKSMGKRANQNATKLVIVVNAAK